VLDGKTEPAHRVGLGGSAGAHVLIDLLFQTEVPTVQFQPAYVPSLLAGPRNAAGGQIEEKISLLISHFVLSVLKR
jgi:hypothetical protein